jgi:tRNA (adenine57-N1/adenine58-N1)-methyltransferase
MGWVDVTMIELNHKRLDVRRDRIGLREEGLRGVNPVPATVEESLERLRENENKIIDYHTRKKRKQNELKGSGVDLEYPPDEVRFKGGPGSRQERLDNIRDALKDRKLYKEGRLIHKTEPEMKTHTSFLVFAILPRAWTDEDEARAAAQWEVNDAVSKD